MALRRVPRVNNPELSPAFEGRQRVLAAVVHAALKRAGYDVQFLGPKEGPEGLSIGLSGSIVTVSVVKNPSRFTLSDAQRSVRRSSMSSSERLSSRLATSPSRGKVPP